MAEDPSLARKLIAGYLDAGEAAPRAARRRALAAAEAALEASLAQLSAEDGDELRRLVALGQGYNAARESRAFYQLLAGGLPRIPLMELGRRLTETDVLKQPGDIFYLDMERATEAAAGKFPGAAAHATTTRQNYEHWATLDAPLFVGAPPPPYPEAFRARFVGMFGERVEQDGGDTVVKGIAAGKGVAEGIARVIASLDEIERLQPGDVLVCKSTAPPWTPLFGIASAVVADAGGVQSHTAIVAREFAIPCVVSTGDGTRRIPDGARVRVDGGEGTIELL
jgi:pyruvate,water dikinase